MKIALIYISVTGGPISHEYASKFLATYDAFPPGEQHDLIIACNGGPPSYEVGAMFSLFPCKLWPRNNEGWDIGAYIEAAKGPAAYSDLMICMGESVYFTKKGWLSRIVECASQFGPGMYGVFSSNAVRTHLNTSAFATSPELLLTYPRRVVTRADRYEFEHGETAYWRRMMATGRPAKLVTWDGFWNPEQWRKPNNILWRGDQSNMLLRCNHADGFDAADHITKARWQRSCDQPFR